MNIIQDRKKDNQQLFIKVDLPFLVDRIHINGTIVLHHCMGSGYGASPIYFIESRMHILDDIHEELLIVLTELNH